MKVDAHQHYWLFTESEFGWLEGPYESLRRDFMPTDALPEMRALGVQRSVAVQARETAAENAFLLDLAGRFPFIAGVVGWVDFRTEGCRGQLETLASHSGFKGLRHIAQGRPQGFFSDSSFLNGIAMLAEFDLAYDILIYESQLEEASELVGKFPNQRFVLDHGAKPPILSGNRGGWARNIRQIARADNLCCKLSGLVTEADHVNWNSDALKVYVDLMLESFGPQRLMIGSDWPVCLAAGEYGTVMGAQEELLRELSETEQNQVLGGTATQFYRL